MSEAFLFGVCFVRFVGTHILIKDNKTCLIVNSEKLFNKWVKWRNQWFGTHRNKVCSTWSSCADRSVYDIKIDSKAYWATCFLAVLLCHTPIGLCRAASSRKHPLIGNEWIDGWMKRCGVWCCHVTNVFQQSLSKSKSNLESDFHESKSSRKSLLRKDVILYYSLLSLYYTYVWLEFPSLASGDAHQLTSMAHHTLLAVYAMQVIHE